MIRNIFAVLACLFGGHEDAYEEREPRFDFVSPIGAVGDMTRIPEVLWRCERCGRERAKEESRGREARKTRR